MDSLLANYASSDEEEESRHQQPQLPPPKPTNSSSLFSSLPKPKSSSSSSSSSPLFQSLPKPQKTLQNSSLLEDSRTTPKPSSLFTSLPQPKSQKPTSNFSSSETNSKRVVQFTPPLNPYSVKSSKFDDDDEDEEEKEKERRRRRESESSSRAAKKGSLLSFMPAPKNSVSLGVLPSAGSGRRAIVETDDSVSNSVDMKPENNDSRQVSNDTNGGTDISGNYETGIDQNAVNYAEYYSYGNYESGSDQNGVNYGYYEHYNSGIDQSGDGSGYGGPGSYGEYGQQYGNNWAEGSAATTATAVPEVWGATQSGFGVKGKRGRSEIPTEIVEVKQDELMKNRPREDQAKLTGIAFGPSYQPVSTKGKPSKLHKRKHQISALYYDMKQKEMELAERRSKGFLTKAETQAKYGW